MILYHFTQLTSVEPIQKLGINKGITPIAPDFKAVSLTSVLQPHGHGLPMGEFVTPQSREYAQIAKKRALYADLSQRTDGIQMPDLAAAVIEVEVPDEDARLKSFEEVATRELAKRYPFVPAKKRDQMKAIAILSASYPLGMDHVSFSKQVAQADEILAGKRQHKAADWYFYLERLPASYIKAVKYRQEDGTYC